MSMALLGLVRFARPSSKSSTPSITSLTWKGVMVDPSAL